MSKSGMGSIRIVVMMRGKDKRGAAMNPMSCSMGVIDRLLLRRLSWQNILKQCLRSAKFTQHSSRFFLLGNLRDFEVRCGAL